MKWRNEKWLLLCFIFDFRLFDFSIFRLFDFLCLQYLASRAAVSSNFGFSSFQFSLFFSSHVFIRRTIPGYTRFIVFFFSSSDFWISGFLDFWISGFRDSAFSKLNFQISKFSNFRIFKIMKSWNSLRFCNDNDQQQQQTVRSAVQCSAAHPWFRPTPSHSLPLPTQNALLILTQYSIVYSHKAALKFS